MTDQKLNTYSLRGNEEQEQCAYIKGRNRKCIVVMSTSIVVKAIRVCETL